MGSSTVEPEEGRQKNLGPHAHLNMHKNTQTSIKLILYSILVASIIIGGAFIAGTFYPNNWTVVKIKDEVHKDELMTVKLLGLEEPEFEFTDKPSFITATGKCVDYLNYTTDRMSRVPKSIIIAMAGIESAWGQSRFAVEGNALFGVRTWDLKNTPHMKARGNPDAEWGVKKYKTKCQSVQDMIRILNTHPAYEKFRTAREHQIDAGKWNYRQLLAGMTAWSTNPDYQEIILQTIVDNKLP